VACAFRGYSGSLELKNGGKGNARRINFSLDSTGMSVYSSYTHTQWNTRWKNTAYISGIAASSGATCRSLKKA
jgi:hypothetical protein